MKSEIEKCPECFDKRVCFAKKTSLKTGTKVCTILNATYEDGKCPFRKPKRGEKK